MSEKASPEPPELPALGSDAAERVESVLRDARSLLSGKPTETHTDSAMTLYLDSIAWEYVLTQSSTAFEALVDKIGWKARNEFAGDASVAEDRQRYWIREAQERARNGIVGLVIPIRVKGHQIQVFHELEHQFGSMPRQKGELQAILLDGARFHIWSSLADSTDDELHREKFEHLARQAMAALDFRFSDSTRAIFYWLQLLKQKSPLLKGWNTKRLCLASENFCRELKTRAQESTSLGSEEVNTQAGITAQVISPGSIPSGQSIGQPPQPNVFPAAIASRRSHSNSPDDSSAPPPARVISPGSALSKIEKFANDAFEIDRDRIIEKYAEKKNRVLNEATRTGNRGAYLPALVEWAAERERELALARADAWMSAFRLFGEPSDARAEEALKTSARLSAAGSISALRGELRLRAARLRTAEEGQGIPWHLQIERASHSAVKEGLLRLRQQRLPASPAVTVPSTTAAPRPTYAARTTDDKSKKSPRKGDVALLANKSLVSFRLAEEYLGISERQRQSLIKQGVLSTEGKGQNKKVTTQSLLAYLPEEKPK
jgi:hypothetical protein